MNWQEHIVRDAERVRLDRYLKRIFPTITQGVIEKAIRRKDIKVNNKRAISSMHLHDKDVISYFAGVISGDNGVTTTSKLSYDNGIVALAKKIIGEYLIYESEELIAINKPYGLAVQGGSKINLSVDHALQYLNETKGSKFKLVHRLDKATSGVLLIAKGYVNATKLTGAFKDKLIAKTYVAELSGLLEKNFGVIDNYIGKYNADMPGDNDSKEIMHVVDADTGKRAITRYKVISTDSNRNVSKVEFYPETGRTHQLRVHSKYLGCPIVGDIKYNGPKWQRMMLHAKRLVISKTVLGREIVIEANDYHSKSLV